MLIDFIYLEQMQEEVWQAIEDSVELVTVRSVKLYAHGNEERLIQAARGDKFDGLEVESVLKKAKKEKRLQD